MSNILDILQHLHISTYTKHLYFAYRLLYIRYTLYIHCNHIITHLHIIQSYIHRQYIVYTNTYNINHHTHQIQHTSKTLYNPILRHINKYSITSTNKRLKRHNKPCSPLKTHIKYKLLNTQYIITYKCP